MARTAATFSPGRRVVQALCIVAAFVARSSHGFTPLPMTQSSQAATHSTASQQAFAPRVSTATDAATLKRDIAQNLRMLSAQRRRSSSESSSNAAAATAALREVTARLYEAPARSAWTSATTSAVAAVNMISSSTALPTRKTSSSRGGGSTVLDRPAPKIGVEVVEEAQQPKFTEKFKVMLFNDNGNTREYVAKSLVQVVGLPEADAFTVMLKAHKDGMACVGIWHGELAEAYCDQLKTRGIISDLFPVD